MRILLVSGSYPPNRCGVGDYVFQLAKSLSENKAFEIAVLTSAIEDINTNPNIKVFNCMTSWRMRDLFRALSIVCQFKPEIVHLQYPTQGYDGRLPKYLPLFLRIMGIKVVQTWHEYFYESGVNLFNLFACNSLIYVRDDFRAKVPKFISMILSSFLTTHIPNAASIRPVELSDDQLRKVRAQFPVDKSIVCFFGFAHSNKGLENIFKIADPRRDHLVFICELNEDDHYQAQILQLIQSDDWSGRVTVTGFLPENKVAEILAVSDAAIFPFPNGTGDWNTTLKAAQACGLFSVATTIDRAKTGFDERRNTQLTGCDDILAMSVALSENLGRRVKPNLTNEWNRVAVQHLNLYQEVIS